MGKTTREIVLVKKNIRLQEWSRQIEEQKSSGLNVQDWCTQNGVNPKTYYYHIRRVREEMAVMQNQLSMFPVNSWHTQKYRFKFPQNCNFLDFYKILLKFQSKSRHLEKVPI